MRNPIKAVQSYAVSMIVGLFAFPKRLIVGIARFLKWLINSVRPRAAPTTVDPIKSPEPFNEATQPHTTPAKASLVKPRKRLSEEVWSHAAPTTVDPVKSPEPINETTQPHAAPAKTSLFKIPKWLIKTIIGAAIFAAFGALFDSPAFVGLSAIIGVSILGILGVSTIKIIMLFILGFFR